MDLLNYRHAFLVALTMHLLLLILIITDSWSNRPVLTAEKHNTPGVIEPKTIAAQQSIIKAVAVDNKEVMETVNRLKQERAEQKQAEISRQKALERQAEQIKRQRLQEQQHLAELKAEANKIAIAHKLQEEEEKKRLKALAEQKVLEAKRIEDLKKQKEKLVQEQQREAKRLALMNQKAQHMQQAREEQLKAEQENKKQAQMAAAQQSLRNAEQQARLVGEVNKYKALIINAISRHWILPENVDGSLSSQFRIRLAPDGTVLEVALAHSSGDPLLDRSAQTAIYKASPLPVPSDAATFNLFREISLTVRPEQVRG